MKYHIYGASDVGKRRKHNEDTYLTKELGNGAILAAVADGVASSPGGNIASHIARRCILEYFNDSYNRHNDGNDMIKCAMLYANNTIAVSRQATPAYGEMASTITVVLVNLSKMEITIGHVGDSRLYRFQNDNLSLLTADDVTRIKHKLSKWAGEHVLDYAADYFHVETIPIAVPSSFLLCTDGLHGSLKEDTIKNILSNDSFTHADKINCLIKAANDTGGVDNITAIIIELTQ